MSEKSEKGARLRVHPLALMFPLMFLAFGSREEVFALMAGLAVHEGAHLIAARLLGVGVSELRLMPFGGAIGLENPYVLSPARLAGVSAAGPLASATMVLFSTALAHWGLLAPLPALAAARVNLLLLGFNLLPALPLDGGRLLYALLFPRIGRKRAANIGIAMGRVLAVLLAALAICLALIARRFNLSFLIASVFLLASGEDERRALSGISVQAMLRALRPLNHPVPARMVAVNGDCPVRYALRAARSDALTLYAVYDGSRLSSFTDERRLLEAALRRDSEIPVSEALER